eukprot:CAMPEP_0169396482 /NCGR_PEP_ID=MMETSP1017-20121227/51374_1 /TAXON_ID=342587 /ORGANISM="Karlodinium micrum, Strain CCMP2283" /LENGTH=59 /DNA_ID=CAMNT_0009500889 /DNA_START=448 /DNA_END=627 /DNA_ORIENTATION=-
MKEEKKYVPKPSGSSECSKLFNTQTCVSDSIKDGVTRGANSFAISAAASPGDDSRDSSS